MKGVEKSWLTAETDSWLVKLRELPGFQSCCSNPHSLLRRFLDILASGQSGGSADMYFISLFTVYDLSSLVCGCWIAILKSYRNPNGRELCREVGPDAVQPNCVPLALSASNGLLEIISLGRACQEFWTSNHETQQKCSCTCTWAGISCAACQYCWLHLLHNYEHFQHWIFICSWMLTYFLSTILTAAIRAHTHTSPSVALC